MIPVLIVLLCAEAFIGLLLCLFRAIGNPPLAMSVLAVLACSLAASDASACNRCGLFGRRCRFAAPAPIVVKAYTQVAPVVHHTPYVAPVQQYAAPVQYHAPAYQAVEVPSTTQNFIFNNQSPQPLVGNAYSLLSPGNSVYGYSLAATAYAVDAAQVLDRSARLTEAFQTSAAKALADHNGTINGALQLAAEADRTGKNTAVAIAALQANSSSQPAQSQTLSLKVKDGRLSIESSEAQPAAAPPCNCQPNQGVPPPAPADGKLSLNAPIGLEVCAKCHDGRGTHGEPVDVVISPQRAQTKAELDRNQLAVKSGKMPPKNDWTPDQREQFSTMLKRYALQ